MKILNEWPEQYGKWERHDWETFLDGQIRRLEGGVDFKCRPQSFQTLAMSAAKRRGLKVRVTVTSDKKDVIIQGFPDEKPEPEPELEPIDPGATPIEELGLATRTVNVLKRNDGVTEPIQTVEELVKLTRRDLYLRPGCGRAVVLDIVERLTAAGKELGP